MRKRTLKQGGWPGMERGPGHSQGAGTGFQEAERLQGLLFSCTAKLLPMQLDFYAEDWCTENREGCRRSLKLYILGGVWDVCMCIHT